MQSFKKDENVRALPPTCHRLSIPPPHCLTQVESGIPELTLSKSVSLLPCFLLGSPPFGAAFPLHPYFSHFTLLLLHGMVGPTPPLMGKSFLFQFLAWGILKVPPLPPCPAIGCWQLYFTIGANWGQAFCSLCVGLCKWVSWVTQLL